MQSKRYEILVQMNCNVQWSRILAACVCTPYVAKLIVYTTLPVFLGLRLRVNSNFKYRGHSVRVYYLNKIYRFLSHSSRRFRVWTVYYYHTFNAKIRLKWLIVKKVIERLEFYADKINLMEIINLRE